jgi:hypothetical protein
VPEVPGERAENRRPDPVQLLVVERLDQRQGPLSRFAKRVGDRCLRLRVSVDRDGENLIERLLARR